MKKEEYDGSQKIETNTSVSVRVRKGERQRINTQLSMNQSIVGDSIEVVMEKIKEGEGEDSIEDRDLVYNDNESTTVNPLTNIRTDKFEAMLEEKIGEYDHKHKKIERTVEAEKKKEADPEATENGKEGKKGTIE